MPERSSGLSGLDAETTHPAYLPQRAHMQAFIPPITSQKRLLTGTLPPVCPLNSATHALGLQALYAKGRMTAAMAQSSIKYLAHLAPVLVLPTLQLRIVDGLQERSAWLPHHSFASLHILIPCPSAFIPPCRLASLQAVTATHQTPMALSALSLITPILVGISNVHFPFPPLELVFVVKYLRAIHHSTASIVLQQVAPSSPVQPSLIPFTQVKSFTMFASVYGQESSLGSPGPGGLAMSAAVIASGPEYMVEALELALPGIDANDIDKMVTTLRFFEQVHQLIREQPILHILHEPQPTQGPSVWRCAAVACP